MWDVKEIAEKVYDSLCSNDEYAENTLCDKDVERVKELYKELKKIPEFKDTLTEYDKSINIGMNYLESNRYDLFDIYLSNTNFEIIKDEGDYNLFCYLPETITNEKFIQYYNQFIEKSNKEDYSLIFKFIDAHIYSERLPEYKEKIFLLLDEIPRGVLNKEINASIFSIFEIFILMNVSNEDQNKYEEIVFHLLDKASKQNWASILSYHISEKMENTGLLEKILLNTKYKEYMYNTNNYDDIYEKYNEAKWMISEKYINLLSPDFINLQKEKMMSNISFLLKKNTGPSNIFLDCSLYSISKDDEKEIIKSEIKKAILKNENLFLITKYESTKNDDINLVKKSRESLLSSFERFILFMKKNNNSNKCLIEDVVFFTDSYMEMFSLNDNDIINKDIIYDKAKEIYPELAIRLQMKEEKRNLEKIIKKDSSVEGLSKKRI